MSLKNTIQQIGKLEAFEIKNYSALFLFIGPAIFIYSLLIYKFNTNAIEIFGAREILCVVFIVVGLLPFTKNKFVLNSYGWIVFFVLLLLIHYLIYTSHKNGFSMDYLLGTYTALFGSVLMLSNRFFIIFFSATCLIHMFFRIHFSEMDEVIEGAVIVSMLTIFLFSFLVLNSSIRYKKHLLNINSILDKKVKSRTEDLEKRADELSEKNQDLEQFAYVVSHDLKKPIRNIYTLTQWLKEDNEALFNDEINRNLELIKAQSNQMEMLINGILNYSLQKKESEELEHVDLNELLTNLIDFNITEKCQISLSEDLPNVYSDKSQLVQVFQNLIQNAIKYNDKAVTEIIIGYQEKKTVHQFSVADNGMGIEQKYFDKIFQLFQRLDLEIEKDSIGIGLALVKKIINKQGGDIWLESELKKGTTFYFTLPKELESENTA